MFAKRAADVIANDKSQKGDNFPDVDLASYPNKDERAKEFKSLIMNEIKRKDNDFYAKWCDNED